MQNCSFMANSDDMEAQTSWIIRGNIFFSTGLCALNFIGTYYCIKTMRKCPIINDSTQILLYASLIYAIIHDVAHRMTQFWLLFRSFAYSDDPCNIMFNVTECLGIGRFQLVGISGMIYIHSALACDGLLATLSPIKYVQVRKTGAICLALIVASLN
ncbi:unnamed protein product [Caenorhabditis bovis]|uniref:G protein-coupled receptor n=1 Tax=Caenorhabditis bovis TaxID=2654633 RepID=A0A8S1EZN8_9PELO|nr:unnamed protein product [Caenorhabditis bovis]